MQEECTVIPFSPQDCAPERLAAFREWLARLDRHGDGFNDADNDNIDPEDPSLDPDEFNERERRAPKPLFTYGAAPDLKTPELTIFENSRGPLVKSFSLDADGNLVKTPGGQMGSGRGARVTVPDARALASLINAMTPRRALAMGALRSDLPPIVRVAPVRVVKKRALNGGAAPDLIARTRGHMTFRPGSRSFVLIDFDTADMPAAVKTRIEQCGGFVGALTTIIPELKDAGTVLRASTSAGLVRTRDGHRFPGGEGLHCYVQILDAADSDRFLRSLHEHAWLAGFGWIGISAAGSALERSIVDRMVGVEEHLCFEGPPPCKPGVRQDAAIRAPHVKQGGWLDTHAACPPLDAREKYELDKLLAEAKHAAKPECARVEAARRDKEKKDLIERGLSEKDAEKIARKFTRGVLMPEVKLVFADTDIGTVTVGDVLADPDKFVDEPLADPHEGVDYKGGAQCAKVLRRYDGLIFIRSHAHGETFYELKYNAEAIRRIMAQTAKDEAVDKLIALSLIADLDPVETANLIKETAEKAGVGLRPLQNKYKEAHEQHDKERHEAMQEAALAARTDPRPQYKAPHKDTPWLGEMQAYDAILGAVMDEMPPSRHIEDELNCARCTVVPGTHAFAANSKDDKAAPQWNICKLSNADAANLLEKHIDFIAVTRERRYSVQCPPAFVAHYRQWHDSTLPRGIAFVIDDKLRECLPTACITDKTKVAKALGFLLDEWLVDVKCSFTDKCTALALCLTMIERSLLVERPVGFITAPSAESGKTTLAKMMVAAVTGLDAVASAWSPSEEERRKALLAYFDAGLIDIVWDNIKDGAQISCPHVERSCTASYYADRKLGVSEIICTSAATVHIFTGVNIAPRGALASRTLSVRIDTDLVDPMARIFAHTNPVAWTKANRPEILGKLYTIMLANPMLRMPADASTKTRFPMWYRLVGAAVEHAARCYKEANPENAEAIEVDFEALFAAQKANESESLDLGSMVIGLDDAMRVYTGENSGDPNRPARTKEMKDGEFIARETNACVNAREDYMRPKGTDVVRDFMLQDLPTGATLSAITIGRTLTKYKDKWRVVGAEKVCLRVRMLRGLSIFRVERVAIEVVDDAAFQFD
jgi:hypothetical protein